MKLQLCSRRRLGRQAYSLAAITEIIRQVEDEAPASRSSQYHNGNGCHPCDQPGAEPVLHEGKGAEERDACDPAAIADVRPDWMTPNTTYPYFLGMRCIACQVSAEVAAS